MYRGFYLRGLNCARRRVLSQFNAKLIPKETRVKVDLSQPITGRGSLYAFIQSLPEV